MTARIEDLAKVEYAPGIPSKKISHELPQISSSKTWEFALHEHEAEKRGLHYDLRLGDTDTGHAHSWAMETHWPEPGESVWAIQQPTHTVKYMDFEGKIPEGYGAGNVSLKAREKTEILKAEPGHINFNLYRGKGPEEYTLHRVDDKKWKLFNRTLHREQVPDVPIGKPKYRSVDISEVDFEDPKFLMSAKIDDAHNLFLFPKEKQIRVISYRASNRDTGVIEHTQKVSSIHGTKSPEAIAGAVVRGGLYAIHPVTKQATPTNILAGLLNSNVWKSREDQKSHGKLRPVIYDVVAWKGKDVSQEPYEKKLEILQKIHEALPQFELPHTAKTKEDKKKLFDQIVTGKIPETKEGIVLWPLHTGEPPIKAKILEDHDVYVRGVFDAESGSKYEGNAVGGFVFSHTPTGKIVGRVGTGLSDEQRRDMYKAPDRYHGLIARVTAMEKYPSGALRAPAFQGFHLDKNDQERLDMVKHADLSTPLQPHQQRVVDRIQQPDQPGLLVVHGLGTGKSLTGLAAADALKKPTTAVVPASLRPNWQKEIAKHVTPGTTPPPIQIQSLQAVARNRKPINTGLLLADEAHRLRDPESASSQAMHQAQAQKRLLLTATPFYNRPADIAPQINIAAGREVLPESPQQFEKRYVSQETVSPGLIGRIMGIEPGEVSRLNPAKQEELRQIFSKWVDYHQNAPGDPNFPTKNEETVHIPMTERQRDVYDVVMNKAPLWLRLKVKMGLPPNIQEARQLNAFLNAARQVANTTRSIAPGIPAQEPKLQRAAQDMSEMLAKNERAKAVAYSNYLDSGLHPYAELLRSKGIPYGLFTGQEDERAKAELVRSYNEGKIRALLLSSAGGEGLDLKGTRLLQLLDPHWNEEKLHQIVGRGVRYKSHEALSPEERDVQVRRYLTTYPQQTGLLHRIGLRQQDKAVDEYLAMLAQQKSQLIGQFQGLFPQQGGVHP